MSWGCCGVSGNGRRDGRTEVLEGMVELFAGEEGTSEDWIKDVSEMIGGEVEGAEGVVDMIVISDAFTDNRR